MNRRKLIKGIVRHKGVGRALLVLSLAFTVFLLQQGCGKSGPSSPEPSKTVAAPIGKPKSDSPSAHQQKTAKTEVPEFVYDPAGKSDPFKPFIQLEPVKAVTRKTPLTPLQRYELSQLKLVAIITTPEGNIALVEDAAGKGFFLKKGTLVGRNDGKVTKILKDRVIVEEQYQDVLGQTKQSEISLYLHQLEEEKEP